MIEKSRGESYKEAFALARLPERIEDLQPTQKQLIRDYITDSDYCAKQRGLVRWAWKNRKTGSNVDSAKAFIKVYEHRWKVAEAPIRRWLGGRNSQRVRSTVFEMTTA